MRSLVLLTVIVLCLSGCSRKCFMLFDYRCEKVSSNSDSDTVQQNSTPKYIPAPTQTSASTQISTQTPPNVETVQAEVVPDSPCGPEQICEFNIDLYSQWLARKINATLIEKDYIEQNITIQPKCEEVGCLPPPFHNTFEGMLQGNLLFYGVGLREIEDENSLTLRYQAQVVPIVNEKMNNMSKLVLTTTIVKAGKFIFSNTSLFTINKWDAWQYRISAPASIIPITQTLPPQSAQQPAVTPKLDKNIIEPQPITSNNS